MKRIQQSFLALLVAIAVGTITHCGPEPDAGVPGSAELTVLMPDGSKIERDLAVDGSATVLDGMLAAEDTELDLEVTGSGTDAMVVGINGVEMEATGRAWIYTVNGKLADRGVESIVLSDGDRLRWCYLSYEEKGECEE